MCIILEDCSFSNTSSFHFKQIMIEHLHTLPGIVLNTFLLYLIKRFSRKDLGAYKYLLATFAVYDIFLIIMHAVIDLRAVITDELFGVISFNFIDTSIFTSLYGACFMVPFSLLNIHFLYRFWVIKFPYLTVLFSQTRFIALLAACVAVPTSFWFCICEFGLDTTEVGISEARRQLAYTFNRTSIDGWFVFQKNGVLSARTVGTLLAYDAVMAIMCMTSVFLATRTFQEIEKAKALSFSDRNSQMRILMTLCIQTAVPFIFVYSPFLCFFNLPLMGFHTPTVAADAAPYIHSVFPMLDALVIILLMKDYRNGAAQLLLFYGRDDQAVSFTTTSTFGSQTTLRSDDLTRF